MIFVVLSNIFRVLQPQSNWHALDTIVLYLNNPTQEGSVLLRSNLMKFGLLVLAYAVLMGIFMYFMRQTIIVVSRWIEYDLRKVIFNHYLQQDNSFFLEPRTGDLMSRILEDVNKVRMYLGPVLLYGINLVALFIVVIFTMVQVNPKLALFTLLPFCLLSAIIYWVIKSMLKGTYSDSTCQTHLFGSGGFLWYPCHQVLCCREILERRNG